MSRLEQEKALIEHRIQELRSFEREYRLKLKAYIENQLADLEEATTAPTERPSNAIDSGYNFGAQGGYDPNGFTSNN